MINAAPETSHRIWTRIILSLWVAICSISLFSEELGALEGRAVPVISGFHIISADETPDGATVIRAEGIKTRSCALRGVDWSLISDGLESAVGFDNREIQRVNRTGIVRVGPWVVYASKDELLGSGRAVIVHRCHPMFLTRTPIFDARGGE